MVDEIRLVVDRLQSESLKIILLSFSSLVDVLVTMGRVSREEEGVQGGGGVHGGNDKILP